MGDIGTAGLKDRHAVSRQYVSVPAKCEPLLSQLEGDGIRVLRVSKHNNKLRAGHLRGNKFRILIRDADASKADSLKLIVERLKSQGLPNYYGSQRFGVDGETSRMGFAMLRGERLPRRPSPFLRKLGLSAAQSWLYNDYLAKRLTDGLLQIVLPGDVMVKRPFGGMFTVTDRDTEQGRFDRREIVHAGPMFGRKMFPTTDEAARREAEVLASANLPADAFDQFGKLLQGTRRANLIDLGELRTEWESRGLRLEFSLPSGSYATVLLREMMKGEALADVDGVQTVE
jgi:tRNA pseudouridine13 synthase